MGMLDWLRRQRKEPKPVKIKRDGQFIAYDNGIVKDTKTGLEWYAGPDKDTSWYTAKNWVENLTVAGGGWRMPTRYDFRSLFNKGAGERNMTPLLKTTGWWIWSDETRGSSSAWIFIFNVGDGEWVNLELSDDKRGFAVRSRG